MLPLFIISNTMSYQSVKIISSNKISSQNQSTTTILCGLVAQWLRRWTCDQQVAGSTLGRRTAGSNHGQVFARVPTGSEVMTIQTIYSYDHSDHCYRNMINKLSLILTQVAPSDV